MSELKLTGKCLEYFKYWFIRQDSVSMIENTLFNKNELSETALNAHIIDFFDSVENIDIFVSKWSDTIWQWSIDDGFEYPSENDFKSRSEATIAAIIKANELYNSSHD